MQYLFEQRAHRRVDTLRCDAQGEGLRVGAQERATSCGARAETLRCDAQVEALQIDALIETLRCGARIEASRIRYRPVSASVAVCFFRDGICAMATPARIAVTPAI